MNKAIIGAVLRDRIKEQGYTQEEFALEAGIGYSSLKKYISGQNAYTYEVMELFAEKLECSYDYLLGKSKSPNREYHEIIEQTRLSEEAVAKIVKYAKHYDVELEARRYIKTLDLLLCENGALNSIGDFFFSSKLVNEMVKGLVSVMQDSLDKNPIIKQLGIEEDRQLSVETQVMIDIIIRLKNLKHKITPEFLAELKELDTQENYKKGLENIAELLNGYVILKREDIESSANG